MSDDFFGKVTKLSVVMEIGGKCYLASGTTEKLRAELVLQALLSSYEDGKLHLTELPGDYKFVTFEDMAKMTGKG